MATGSSRRTRAMGVTASVRLLHLVLDPRTPGPWFEDWLASAGLSLADVADPDARISHAALEALLARGVAMTGDQDLGLHLAERVKPGAFDVMECIARTSPTLGDALRGLGRYHRVLHDAWRIEVRVEGERAVARFGLAPPLRLSRAAAEFCMASLFVVARRTFEVPLDVHEVRFEHDAPKSMREHARILGVPVRFAAGANEVVFSAALLRLPLPTADAGVCAVLERHAATLLERLPASERFADRVRASILAELPRGNPALKATARKLGASGRTVRRRLAEEGMTYQALVDDVRRELASRYLDAGLSVEEVACALGFSEASALRRAFRRWTGERLSVERRRRGA